MTETGCKGQYWPSFIAKHCPNCGVKSKEVLTLKYPSLINYHGRLQVSARRFDSFESAISTYPGPDVLAIRLVTEISELNQEEHTYAHG